MGPKKKFIAIVLSVLLLVACFAVARWAEGNTKVTVPATDPITTTPTMTTGTEPTNPTTAPSDPDDIENGLGWG